MTASSNNRARSRPHADRHPPDTGRLAAHRATLDRPTDETVPETAGRRRGAKARTHKSRRRLGA